MDIVYACMLVLYSCYVLLVISFMSSLYANQDNVIPNDVKHVPQMQTACFNVNKSNAFGLPLNLVRRAK